MSARRNLGASAALFAAAGLPPLSNWLEADMARHMLLQFPLLLLAGTQLGLALPAGARRRMLRWNAHGLSGLALFVVVTGVWMIPRALDMVLLSTAMEAAKFVSLLAAGAALSISWRAATPVVQAFFLGNWAWMSAFVGLLYQDNPARLCNFYLVDQQVFAGRGLVALAVALPLVWLVQLVKSGYLRDAPCEHTRADDRVTDATRQR